MRAIKYIVLHCTATPLTTTIESLKDHWKQLGWKTEGYHFVIKPTGEIVNLLDIEKVSNGVAGYNAHSIHISYIGGVDTSTANWKPVDNRTEAQKIAQMELVKELWEQFPNAVVQGHRDFPNVAKACPSFDVKSWLKEVNLQPPNLT